MQSRCFLCNDHHKKDIPKTLLSVWILLALLGILLPGKAQTTTSTQVFYGESDEEIISRLPDLDLNALASMDGTRSFPKIPNNPAPLAEGDIRDVIELQDFTDFPDTLLLYSKGYYGDPLDAATQQMGLRLDREQRQTLETLAAAYGVNSRVLLTLAKIKNAPQRFSSDSEWLKWLYLETMRVRSALEPQSEHPIFQFGSGERVTIPTESINAANWGLLTILGAGNSLAETQTLLADFIQTYQTCFGDPFRDEAQAAATSGFLYKPYQVSLNGRGYYDHQYPSVDVGSPNVIGMLDYLGRTNTQYDTHDGDDLWMPYGSDIFAPYAAQVVYLFDGGPGNKGVVMWANPDTTYDIVIWHLSEVSVALWQKVVLGQKIGKSGAAGGLNHIHFEIRHNGKQVDTMGWYGDGSDPCPAGPGAVNGYRGCESSVWLWADQAPPEFIAPVSTLALETIPGENGWDQAVRAILTAVDNPGGSGIDLIRYQFDQALPNDWQTYTTPISFPEGTHTLYYQADDQAGNWEPIKSIARKVDGTGPVFPANINPACLALHDIWQSTCNDPYFTWSAASDPTSGLAGYEYLWSPAPNSGVSTWTSATSFNPGPTGEGSTYFRVRAKDNAGNFSAWVPFNLRYDVSLPSGRLSLNQDAPTTYTTLLPICAPANDAISGVSKMEVCILNSSCSGWIDYAPVLSWLLPAHTGQDYTVQVQYQDRAGNSSPLYQKTIRLAIYPDHPASSNYRLDKSTWSASGYVQPGTNGSQSGKYQLKGILGQPSIPGKMFSSRYGIWSGYASRAFPIFNIFVPVSRK
jgi:murein DD-endopeptidase MepM/ murein hydrolase activator NlpD